MEITEATRAARRSPPPVPFSDAPARTIPKLAAAALLAAVFTGHTLRAAHPLLDPRLLAGARLRSGVLGVAAIGTVMAAHAPGPHGGAGVPGGGTAFGRGRRPDTGSWSSCWGSWPSPGSAAGRRGPTDGRPVGGAGRSCRPPPVRAAASGQKIVFGGAAGPAPPERRRTEPHG
ncbi:hypothetical protein ACFVH6_42895 [Spirillospora sp. NPDC127200]